MKMKVALFAFFLLLCAQPASACWFVSPTGNDANAGTSSVAPFASLERARTAMRFGVTVCTNVMQGTYVRSAPLVLTSADNGETWIAYASDPVRTAILDGLCLIPGIFQISGGSNITIDGLVMRNVEYYGVAIHGGTASVNVSFPFNQTVGIASGNTVQNSEFYDISAPAFGGNSDFFTSGGVSAEGNVPTTAIRSNYVHDANANGLIVWNDAQLNDNISNSVVQNNVVLKTGGSVSDAGGVYVNDYLATSTNILIDHNYIVDYQGITVALGHGIYMDQALSNTTVTNNVIRERTIGADSTSALFNDCGINNTISNNLIDLGTSGAVSIMGWLKFATGTCTAMTGTTFNKNIIVMAFTGNQHTVMFSNGFSYQFGGSIPNFPTISNNMYFNYAGGQARTDGNGASDGSPVTGSNPLLADNYRLCTASGAPVAGCTVASQALSAPLNFTQLAGGWGPPSFSIPAGY